MLLVDLVVVECRGLIRKSIVKAVVFLSCGKMGLICQITKPKRKIGSEYFDNLDKEAIKKKIQKEKGSLGS